MVWAWHCGQLECLPLAFGIACWLLFCFDREGEGEGEGEEKRGGYEYCIYEYSLYETMKFLVSLSFPLSFSFGVNERKI